MATTHESQVLVNQDLSEILVNQDIREKKIDEPPSQEAAHLAQIHQLMQKNDLRAALDYAKAILHKEPTDAGCHFAIGKILGRLGKNQEALGYLRQAALLESNNADYQIALAIGLRVTGSLQEAVDNLTAVAKAHPNHQEAWNNLGLCLFELQKIQAAEACFNQALEINRDYHLAWNNLGMMRMRASKWLEAVSCFDKAIAIHPAYSEAWINLAEALSHLEGELPRALASLEQALKIQPTNLDVRVRIGYVYISYHKPEEAIKYGLQALAINPHFLPILSMLVAACEAQQDWRRATLFARQILILQPNNHSALLKLAQLAVKQLAPLEALYLAQQALSLAPNEAMCLLTLGIIELLHNHQTLAVKYFNTARTFPTTSHAAGLELAYILLRHGDFAQGLPLYETRVNEAHSPLAKLGVEAKTKLLKLSQNYEGKRLLILAEADDAVNLLFCRLLPLIRQTLSSLGSVDFYGNGVIAAIIGRCFGFDYVYDESNPPRAANYDLVLPLGSVIGHLAIDYRRLAMFIKDKATPITLPNERRLRLPNEAYFTLKIGVVGHSDVDNLRSAYHDVSLTALEPLYSMAEVMFVPLSLAEASGVKPHDSEKLSPDLRKTYPNLMELPAMQDDGFSMMRLLDSLDLVIGADSRLIHLAAAMGKPTWVMLDYGAAWYWHQDNNLCPWYGSVRLFRQPISGDWSLVTQRIRAELETIIKQKTEAAEQQESMTSAQTPPTPPTPPTTQSPQSPQSPPPPPPPSV